MMALGSTLGTTIDGSHKGAGITKMQGEISRVGYMKHILNNVD